jgi:spermidine/putrescine transport system permease protein
VLRRVVVPLLAPAVLSGALIVLYHAVRELAASVMLYTVGNEVISVAIWELYGEGKYVELFALGTILVSLNIVMVIAAQLVFRRFERGRTG